MFALYEQYGVPNASGVGIDVLKTEAAIRAAYGADPGALGSAFRVEIDHYTPLVDRDHSARTYVQLLRRCMGEAVDLEAAHAAKMKAALAAVASAKQSIEKV